MFRFPFSLLWGLAAPKQQCGQSGFCATSQSLNGAAESVINVTSERFRPQITAFSSIAAQDSVKQIKFMEGAFICPPGTQLFLTQQEETSGNVQGLQRGNTV